MGSIFYRQIETPPIRNYKVLTFEEAHRLLLRKHDFNHPLLKVAYSWEFLYDGPDEVLTLNTLKGSLKMKIDELLLVSSQGGLMVVSKDDYMEMIRA